MLRSARMAVIVVRLNRDQSIELRPQALKNAELRKLFAAQLPADFADRLDFVAIGALLAFAWGAPSYAYSLLAVAPKIGGFREIQYNPRGHATLDGTMSVGSVWFLKRCRSGQRAPGLE